MLVGPMTPPADTLIVLSNAGCNRCKVVARHLERNGVNHVYIDLSKPENAGWLEEFRSRNLTQVPQTFRGDSEWVEGVDFARIEALF